MLVEVCTLVGISYVAHDLVTTISQFNRGPKMTRRLYSLIINCCHFTNWLCTKYVTIYHIFTQY